MPTLKMKAEDHPERDFLYCCGAITEVLKFGTVDLHGTSRNTLLFLIIPGNPGVVGFYETFMYSLYGMLGRQHPVWALSHAGHCVPPETMDMVKDASVLARGDVFGLEGQIEHKLAFLRKFVPKETRLILVGHSIGCYIILEMMKRDPEIKVAKSVLLFPTIERMAQTPQGRVMTPILRHLRYFTYLPIFLVSLLPWRLKATFVRLLFGGLRSFDYSVVPATLNLINVDCAANAMYMGGQEMTQVMERDNITIKKNLEKLIFYYGATDHWCPVQYYSDIKRDFPTGAFLLCESGFRHAFVLDSGKEVAQIVVDLIHSDLQM